MADPAADLFYWLRGYMEGRAEDGGSFSNDEIRELLERTDPANPNHALADLYPYTKQREADHAQ